MLKNKKILITGACGTVGSCIIDKLIQDPNFSGHIIAIDNNETKLFEHSITKISPRINFYLSDIRNYTDIKRYFENIDVVLHLAALKHVILNEISPEQAIRTNVVGTQNVIQACLDNRVKTCVFTSSDKAVNPTNVMGTTKLLGERLMTAADQNAQNTTFSSTRFGNVLGSNGSVFTIFKEQLRLGKSLTVTDDSMTRFVMSVEEAADLVLESVNKAKGGEVFVTKMPVIRIVDLATAMIQEFQKVYDFVAKDVQISYIGAKPGEKLYEELMSSEELNRTLELEKFFSILPALKKSDQHSFIYDDILNASPRKIYNSQNSPVLTVKEISKIIHDYGLVK